MQQILNLAQQYNKDRTPPMVQRIEIGEDLEQRLATVLDDVAAPAGLADLDLRVHAGGDMGYISPFPWVRVYSDTYAHSAQNGIYLVYLFAADGSRVYLSLHQGTSVPKPSGGMRTTTDTKTLLFRAAQARSALGDHIESEGTAEATTTIDLAWQRLPSRDSRTKGRAYEAANILALEYQSGRIPADERLLTDLVNMLPLLVELYGVVPAPQQTTGLSGLEAQASAAMTSKREQDPEIRKKIELRAEDVAIADLKEKGWYSKRVGSEKRGYDLECSNQDGKILHVEVKGTRRRGEKVVLTGNEVKHNRQAAAECEADHALYVVSGIEISPEGKCTGGKLYPIQPWSIVEADLIATQYDYTVPRKSNSLWQRGTFWPGHGYFIT